MATSIEDSLSSLKLKTTLQVFVSFPSPYTQTLLLQALTSHLPSLSILPSLPSDAPTPSTPLLMWCDYDEMDHELIHDTAGSSKPVLLASSYIYRKALIRKNFLHLTTHEYLAKDKQRKKIRSETTSSPLEPESILVQAMPKGSTFELQFADELDELFSDELYLLREEMEEAEQKGEKRWWILKPAMSERGMGIRLFSTRSELEEIFEEMEEDSDEEEDENAEGGEEQEEEEDRGVSSSQLRHFVVQEYLPNPLLLLPSPTPHPAPANHKFHLRAYFLLSSSYTTLLSRTTLALFSSLPYSPPSSHEESLLPHLTNTCLQPPMSPGEVNEENVHLLWELEGREVAGGGGGVLTKEVLERVWQDVGEVGAEAIKAAVECGSVHMQTLPNCFEIFGVDFLLTLPPATSTSTSSSLLRPQVHLLEFNASPDFHQSGTRLQAEIKTMFEGVVKGIITPHFGIDTSADDEEEEAEKWDGEWTVGEEKFGWGCFGKGEVRGGGR